MTRQSAILINGGRGETRLTTQLVVIWLRSGCQSRSKLTLETNKTMIQNDKQLIQNVCECRRCRAQTKPSYIVNIVERFRNHEVEYILASGRRGKIKAGVP